MTILAEFLASILAAGFLGLFLGWLSDELSAAQRAGRTEPEVFRMSVTSAGLRAAEGSIGPLSSQHSTGCMGCGKRGYWSGFGPAGVYTPPLGHTVRYYLGDGGVVHNCPWQTRGQGWIEENLRDPAPSCGHWVLDGDGEPLRTPVLGCTGCLD